MPGFAQKDGIGPGRAIQFDGVDDYIDLGNIYDDIQFPLTISAWVYKDNSSQYILPVFVSQDNSPLYNGFWFCLSATNLFFEYGDGRGQQSDAYRKGKSAFIPNLANRWIYVSAVITSSNNVQLFANGFNVGGSIQGSTSLPMSSNHPTDIAKIGYFYTNDVVHRYQGMIDELRIWNRALTQEEIRGSMCRRLRTDEPGLIGHWTFDETSGTQVIDESPKGLHGTLKGNPARVFSGAPVGDESVYLYSSGWSGKTLMKDDLTVTKVSGNPFGVHVYTVSQSPSQTGGLDVASIQVPYHGVFLADDGGNNTFDFAFAEDMCAVFHRSDNSNPQWMSRSVFSGIASRIELIRSLEQAELEIDLGNDVTLCDKTSYWIEPDGISSGQTYLWSTGETSSDITITKSGVYSVEVSEGCQTVKDSILISFKKTPPAFSLGEDQVLCSIGQQTLTLDFDVEGLALTWQDGSTHSSLLVQDFGTFWVKAESECGISIDSITFSEADYLNIELGEDIMICDRPSLWLEPDVSADGRRFLWNTGEETAGITVTQSGRYSVEVSEGCRTAKDSIMISFEKSPPAFSLGEDQVLCRIGKQTLTLDFDVERLALTWQDGSSHPSFLVQDFGTFWVKAESECGISIDSITFSKADYSELKSYNFFSPGTADDRNQYFVIDERLIGARLSVFNRWGRKVYSSLNYNNDWDGGELPSGVYYYTVMHECIEPFKGTVTLMR